MAERDLEQSSRLERRRVGRIIFAKSVRIPIASTLFAATLFISSPFVRAADVWVTAEFRPSALDPARNAFQSTTPPGLYCQWIPVACATFNTYVFDLPISLTKIYVKGDDIRKRWYIAFPARRQVAVLDSQGRQALLDVAVSSYAGQLSPGDRSNPVFTTGVNGGCGYVYTAGHGGWTRFGWSVQNHQTPAPCHSQSDDGEIGFTESYQTTNLGLGLNVTAPSPLSLGNGIYRGSVTYSLGGAGADFDFGDDVVLSDNTLTFNFEFTVAHDFQVSFPPGSDRLVLQPVGGWAPWIDHGRVPGALKNEIPFTVSSSAPFSIALQCQYPVGDQCGIRSDSDDAEVPIEVAISMPGINAMATSTPAMHQRLDTRGRVGFDGAHGYVAHRPSRLHVGVSGQPLATMLKQSGSHWRGQVTVIFDTEL